jgi:type I restriction enzyme, R subunit
LIGVNDGGSLHGLDSDYASLHKEGKDDRDRFGLHLSQLLINAVGEAAATNVTTQIHTVDGHDLCRVHVQPCGFPVDATIVVDKRGNLEKKKAFFVRIHNGTREITVPIEREKYIFGRWGDSQALFRETRGEPLGSAKSSLSSGSFCWMVWWKRSIFAGRGG